MLTLRYIIFEKYKPQYNSTNYYYNNKTSVFLPLKGFKNIKKKLLFSEKKFMKKLKGVKIIQLKQFPEQFNHTILAL